MTTTAPPPTANAANERSDAALDQIDPVLIDADAEFTPCTTMDEEQLRELTMSVRGVGVLQPLTVVGDGTERYRLIAGHLRLAAARAAKLPTVPALVYDTIDAATQPLLRAHAHVRDQPARPTMNTLDHRLLDTEQAPQCIRNSHVVLHGSAIWTVEQPESQARGDVRPSSPLSTDPHMGHKIQETTYLFRSI